MERDVNLGLVRGVAMERVYVEPGILVGREVWVEIKEPQFESYTYQDKREKVRHVGVRDVRLCYSDTLKISDLDHEAAHLIPVDSNEVSLQMKELSFSGVEALLGFSVSEFRRSLDNSWRSSSFWTDGDNLKVKIGSSYYMVHATSKFAKGGDLTYYKVLGTTHKTAKDALWFAHKHHPETLEQPIYDRLSTLNTLSVVSAVCFAAGFVSLLWTMAKAEKQKRL